MTNNSTLSQQANGNGSVVTITNYINGNYQTLSDGESCFLDVTNPSNGTVIARVCMSNPNDVDQAVRAAHSAFGTWSRLTIKARAAILLKFHYLVNQHSQELAKLIVQENGKNITEALADVAKGNETVEYACSLPVKAAGSTLLVSSAVTCQDRRTPLGVVASIGMETISYGVMEQTSSSLFLIFLFSFTLAVAIHFPKLQLTNTNKQSRSIFRSWSPFGLSLLR